MLDHFVISLCGARFWEAYHIRRALKALHCTAALASRRLALLRAHSKSTSSLRSGRTLKAFGRMAPSTSLVSPLRTTTCQPFGRSDRNSVRIALPPSTGHFERAKRVEKSLSACWNRSEVPVFEEASPRRRSACRGSGRSDPYSLERAFDRTCRPRSPHSSRTTWAGLPATTVRGGTSCVTTAPAPTTTPSLSAMRLPRCRCRMGRPQIFQFAPHGMPCHANWARTRGHARRRRSSRRAVQGMVRTFPNASRPSGDMRAGWMVNNSRCALHACCTDGRPRSPR